MRTQIELSIKKSISQILQTRYEKFHKASLETAQKNYNYACIQKANMVE